LRSRYPNDYSSSRLDVLAWHRREADDAERRQHWFGAAWHLTRLIDTDHNEAHLRVRRARAYAELGQWQKALADFNQGLSQGTEPPEVHFQQSLALLGTGDQLGYCIGCAALMKRFDQDQSAAHSLTWRCVLIPGAVADRGRVVSLAEQALKKDPKNPARLFALGAALYRAHRFQEAAERLTEAIEAYSAELPPQRNRARPETRPIEMTPPRPGTRPMEGMKPMPSTTEPGKKMPATKLAEGQEPKGQRLPEKTVKIPSLDECLSPGLVQNWFFLGMAYQRLGQTGLAQEAMRNALMGMAQLEGTDALRAGRGTSLSWTERLELQWIRDEANRLMELGVMKKEMTPPPGSGDKDGK
jgi:tetratricopeptide (TPR) repeat protein